MNLDELHIILGGLVLLIGIYALRRHAVDKEHIQAVTDILRTTITRNAERDMARVFESETRTSPRKADEKAVPKSAWDRILEDD